MSRSFLVTAVVASLTVLPASAAPIPLLEFNFQQSDFENGTLPVMVEFRFEAYGEFSTQYLDWAAQYGPPDIGMSFWATPDIIEGANLALTDPRAGYALYNGPGNFVGPAFFSNVFVDDLSSYTITALERVIDYLVLTEVEPGQHWTISASQTIRYWGTLVPEPGTLLLLSIGAVHLFLNHRPRRPN